MKTNSSRCPEANPSPNVSVERDLCSAISRSTRAFALRANSTGGMHMGRQNFGPANLGQTTADHVASSTGGTTVPAPKHSIMWIDGIGGYLLWDKPELVLGQAFAESHADVGIVGDLSRRAAVIRRMGTDYLIQPLQASKVDGQPIERPQLLRDGSIIELGNSVKICFRRPNALSGTARLELASIHRWKPHVDAVMMLADCCIIGPRTGSHVACPDWRGEALLVQKGGQWQMRIAEEVQVGREKMRGQFPVPSGTCIRGEDFSLSFE